MPIGLVKCSSSPLQQGEGPLEEMYDAVIGILNNDNANVYSKFETTLGD